MDLTKLAEDVKRAEGLRLKPYTDTVGKVTIGYGRNLTDVGLSQQEVDLLFKNDLNTALRQCWGEPFWPHVADHDARARAMVELRFNLGVGKLRGFRKAIAALIVNDFATAANEFLDSAWARQVGDRANRIAAQIRDGTS